MKRFVKISGYDNWFWIIESEVDLDEGFVGERIDSLQNAVKHDLYTNESKTNIKPDWFLRVQTTVTHRPEYRRLLEKYGEPLLIRKIGSFMMLTGHQIVAEYFGDDFPPDNVSEADIVICENDAFPEPKWVEYLSQNYPGKCVYTLNFFSERDGSLDTELDVSIISFSTTFSNYYWFEKILDTIIRNKWSGKEIVGYSHDPAKWNFPSDIQSKVDAVVSAGNKLTIITPFKCQ